MKSAFGSKRRARKIEVDEDEDAGANTIPSSSEQVKTPISNSLNPTRKTFKKSSLRQSIAFDDDLPQDGEDTVMGGQATNKPSIGRSSSMKKKKGASSRLSFGPGEIISGDAAEALEDEETFTPKKPSLGRRIIESNATSNHTPFNGREDDEERPTYSKDYLNELKSSTPTAPKDLQSLDTPLEDETSLDASELEGAMIIDLDADPEPTSIPTEAEIREKKERRARLAHSQDFISLDSTSSLEKLSLIPRKKKEESRLVREDEDLGEGFDEFVQDGRIALGKKQERESKRRHKKEMADMIFAAEGGDGEEESDDSEAERRAAYEAAQTRKGMDGLHKLDSTQEVVSSQVPAKITPLPALAECLARLQATMDGMEVELMRKRKRLSESKQEKGEIAGREREVQELLKQAGERYSALRNETDGAVAGGGSPMVVDRGLESFGNTPVVRGVVEDVG